MYHTDSITHAVRNVLESDWLLFRMLQSGVANITALASKIKPNVEARIGNSVNLNTVVASLTRLLHSLEAEREALKDDKLPLGARLSLSDHVFDMITQLNDVHEFMAVYEEFKKSTYVPFGVILTSGNCRFYIENNPGRTEVEQELPPGFKSENGLTKIKIDFPRELLRVQNNLIYEIASTLYKTHTDVHSAFFTPSGIVLIVESGKAAKVYQMLYERLT